MPKVHVRNGVLTIPLSEEIREKLGVREGDELDAHVFKGSMTITPVSAQARERAWQRIFSIIDRVHVRPGQPALPIAEIEQMVVDEVKAARGEKRRTSPG